MKLRSVGAFALGLMLVGSELTMAAARGNASLRCEPEAFRAPERGLKGLTVKVIDAREGVGAVARLREVTFRRFGRKKKELAVLPCKDVRKDVSSRAGNPDEMLVELECRDPGVVDAGYRIRITQPGFTGVRLAVVSQRSMFGEVDLAELVCTGPRR